MASYDADQDRWTDVVVPDVSVRRVPTLRRLYHWVLFDPTNERVVVLGGFVPTSAVARNAPYTDDVWSYDPSGDHWHRLVPSRRDLHLVALVPPRSPPARRS